MIGRIGSIHNTWKWRVRDGGREEGDLIVRERRGEKHGGHGMELPALIQQQFCLYTSVVVFLE